MELLITYRHPLHGRQEIRCAKLEHKHEQFHVVNIHGVTFQVLDFERIVSIEVVEDDGRMMKCFGNEGE